MLKRKMTEELLAWKKSSKRKVFILLGARQTGKTFIVNDFARSYYDESIYVNFIEDEENARFLASSCSAEELISKLSLIAGHAISEGTLVFLDEVQQLGHDIVTLSKYLLDDNRIDIVLSGSLLGTVLEGVTSFPVGYATLKRMYPLDFEEFCWACGVPNQVVDAIKEAYRAKVPLEPSLHGRMIKLYRRFITVGGMPEAVQDYLDLNMDLGAARSVNTAIAEQNRYDIIKYNEQHKTQILTIYDNIPSQLAKENKRFEFNSVANGAKYDRLEREFSWLTQAGVALQAVGVSEPKSPLLRTLSANRFKLYASDCGMLLSRYPLQSAMDIIEGSSSTNFGAVYENVVAQELQSSGFPLYYFHNNRKGEVDFLVETSAGNVLPIEVKSGKDYKRHSALNNLLSSNEYNIPCAYVLSEFNVSINECEGKPVYYLPLYMTLCLKEELQPSSVDLHMEAISFSEYE